MTKLEKKRNEQARKSLSRNYGHEIKTLEKNAASYRDYDAGFQDALAELMPQVQKLVVALESIKTGGYFDSVAYRALTEWREYVGKE